MLPAPARLRRSADFSAAVRRGARGSSASVTVHLARRDLPTDAVSATTGPRIGFVVSRAVGPAVVRNRVRRRLRHLLRSRLTTLPPADLVVRATQSAATASGPTLARDLDQALRRAESRPTR